MSNLWDGPKQGLVAYAHHSDFSPRQAGFDTRDAILLAEGVRGAHSLRDLVLCGNPIGPTGCHMILRAANALEDARGPGGAGEVSVDLDLCGAVDTFFFNPAEPAGRCACEKCRVGPIFAFSSTSPL
jgi:hypothetical protein